MAELLAALRFDAVSVGLIENAWTALPPLPPKGAAATAAAEAGEARVAGAIAAEVAPREVALVAHLERLCAAHALYPVVHAAPALSAPWRCVEMEVGVEVGGVELTRRTKASHISTHQCLTHRPNSLLTLGPVSSRHSVSLETGPLSLERPHLRPKRTLRRWRGYTCRGCAPHTHCAHALCMHCTCTARTLHCVSRGWANPATACIHPATLCIPGTSRRGSTRRTFHSATSSGVSSCPDST